MKVTDGIAVPGNTNMPLIVYFTKPGKMENETSSVYKY